MCKIKTAIGMIAILAVQLLVLTACQPGFRFHTDTEVISPVPNPQDHNHDVIPVDPKSTKDKVMIAGR